MTKNTPHSWALVTWPKTGFLFVLRLFIGHGLLLGLVVSVVWYCTRPNNDGEHIVIWIFHVYIYIHIIYVSVQCVCAYVCAPAGHPSMKFRTRHNWCPFLIQILVLKQPTAFQHGSKWPYISMIVVVAALLCKWIESQLISQLDVGWLADCWSHIVCFLLSKYMGLFECLKIEYNPKPMACRQFPIHVGSFWEYTPRSGRTHFCGVAESYSFIFLISAIIFRWVHSAHCLPWCLWCRRGTRGDVQPFVALARGNSAMRMWRLSQTLEG